MAEYIINGGRPLVGEIRASGSKNAALPVIFASLICGGVSRIYGIPSIGDTDVALELIRHMGAVVTKNGDFVDIDTSNISYTPPPASLVCRLRASTYLIGACLSAFGVVDIGGYGGCNFSPRPIDMHLSAASDFGAELIDCRILCKKIKPAEIRFEKISVGATVNSLIMAASADGESRIYGAAREPHINTLIAFLRSAGAKIEDLGDCIRVCGGTLGGGTVRIPPDPIEGGTFLAASFLTGGNIRVTGIDTSELDAFSIAVSSGGATVHKSDTDIAISGIMTTKVNIYAAPYPAFPTDLQPVFAPMLACGAGGDIYDYVFPSRFGYLQELSRFGVRFEQFDGWARIYPSELRAASARALDLRCGAACLITALATKGQSIVSGAEIVNRGYEGLADKLSLLGAEIFLSD